MSTRNLLLPILLLCFPIALYSQFSVTPQKSRLVLKDSTVIEGYLTSMPSNVDTLIFFSKKLTGRQKKYGTSQINRLIVLEYDRKYYDSSPFSDAIDSNLEGEWVPMYVNNEIGKIGQVRRGKRLLMEIYQGKNICGYLGYDFIHGFRCYYKLSDQWYAKAFYPFKNINKHRKELLLREFAKYPTLTHKISNGEISGDSITQNPFVLLEELDEILNLTK